MNSLYMDIEAMCGTIKHASNQVDLYEVRSLLRRAQYAIDILDSFCHIRNLNVQYDEVDGYPEYMTTLTASLSKEQLDNVLYYICGGQDVRD